MAQRLDPLCQYMKNDLESLEARLNREPCLETETRSITVTEKETSTTILQQQQQQQQHHQHQQQL